MTRLSKVLILLNLVLTGAVVAGPQGDGVSGVPAAANGRGAESPDAPQNRSFAIRPFEAYAEIGERPLFTADRRRKEGPASAPERPAETELRLSLVGVILGQGTRTALLQNGEPSLLRVSEGQQIQGWILETVHANGIVLRREGSRKVLKLDWKPPGGAVEKSGQSVIFKSTERQ